MQDIKRIYLEWGRMSNRSFVHSKLLTILIDSFEEKIYGGNYDFFNKYTSTR